MSGLAVGYGKPDQGNLVSMLKRIAHRGPYVDGIFQNKRVVMAQNYFEADGTKDGEGIEVPIRNSLSPITTMDSQPR